MSNSRYGSERLGVLKGDPEIGNLIQLAYARGRGMDILDMGTTPNFKSGYRFFVTFATRKHADSFVADAESVGYEAWYAGCSHEGAGTAFGEEYRTSVNLLGDEK